MGLLDGLLSQVAGNVDIAGLAAKVGISPEQAISAVTALGQAHAAPGDTVDTAASATGLSSVVLQQIIGHIGGEGALGQFASLLAGQAGGAGAGGILGSVSGMLDRDGDGNPLNDLAGLAGGLFGKK